MNEQHTLDWRLCHGSRYKYQHLMNATGLSRRQLYRMRVPCGFGQRGVFTYGEALVLLFAHHAHIATQSHAEVLADLAWKIDNGAAGHVLAAIVQHTDGVWTAHHGVIDWTHDTTVANVMHIPTLASTLALAHARLHTVTQ